MTGTLKINLGPLLLFCVSCIACSPRPSSRNSPEPADRSGDGIKAIELVEELSGESYQGRQAGSVGGIKAGDYLLAKLTWAGLQTRVMEFRENVPVYVREPRFSVRLPGKPARELVFRKDYRDSVRGAWIGESAEGPLVYLEDPDADFPAGSALLLSGKNYDNSRDGRYLERGAVALLLIIDAPGIERRATYPGQEQFQMAEPKTGLVKMAVSPDIAELLAESAKLGASVSLANPLGFAERDCKNILASWNGNGGAFEPSIMYMAHYDHIGLDYDGKIFPGALDNASGSALLLSIAENYVKDGIKQDVAFLLSDSEEINLSGASNFARNAPFRLSGLPVINFDMVGGEGNTTLAIYSNGNGESLKLGKNLGVALSAAGIETKTESPVLNVDSGPLGSAGAYAITLCEFDQTDYHSYRDTTEKISSTELDKLENAVYAFALDLATKK